MRWYLSGMPKSGLHLLDALLKPISKPDTPLFWGTSGSPFATADDKSAMDQLMKYLFELPDGHRMIGHACYDERLDKFLYDNHIIHIFISRDLRDVAVSQAHHILSPDHYRFWHPDKAFYWEMNSFEEVLAAVWNGIPGYPGVKERWEAYRGWLDSPYTLCLNYDDIIQDKEKAAYSIINYYYGRDENGERMFLSNIVAISMVGRAEDKYASPTFRRGVPGEWKQYRHIFEKNYERV